MKKRLYLDCAATSWPKAPGVAGAMAFYLTDVGCNVGHGAYQAAYDVGATVLDVRKRLCRMFGGPAPQNVVLTSGATHALNLVLNGLLRPGDRVVTSPMEHNSVLRPLHRLEARGVRVDYLACGQDGALLPGQAEALIGRDVRLVVLTHASNVCGTLMPIAKIGRLCRENGVFFCVDGAQTAGSIPIDMKAMGIDALALPGHKGLLGPQGVGALLLSDTISAAMEPLLTGGTGSRSDSLDMPDFLPDRFEAGTLNLPGIYGLQAALDWLEAQDGMALRDREIRLTGHLLARMRELEPDGLRVLGTFHAVDRVGIVSVDFPGLDNTKAAFRLEQNYGIQCRCGLHSAPLAHQTLGTFPQGTVRFSVGPFTRFEDIDYLQAAVCDIMEI
ncbi:MAG: aminotransferase class V-fold PLP-dependent enzyme [Intestinimonas sp.]|jgi:cysteine desulfurase family protein|nr:aminotransferase class V-fold PLP-dependent enzyme [Intestinimonas sp.]